MKIELFESKYRQVTSPSQDRNSNWGPTTSARVYTQKQLNATNLPHDLQFMDGQ